MFKRSFYSFEQFLEATGLDQEDVRQALIARRLRAFVELKDQRARSIPAPCPYLPTNLSEQYASIRLLKKSQSDDTNEADAKNAQFDFYALSGWWEVDSDALERGARVGEYFDLVVIFPERLIGSGAHDEQFDFKRYVQKDYLGSFYAELDVEFAARIEELWFDRRSVDEALGSVPSADSGSLERPLDQRERKSMLRIIAALANMAMVPDRGATAAIELQLAQLGFKGPGEATIRTILTQARRQTSDESQWRI